MRKTFYLKTSLTHSAADTNALIMEIKTNNLKQYDLEYKHFSYWGKRM